MIPPTLDFSGLQQYDGASDDQYVGQFENLEAATGRSYGVNIRAGSNSTDHGFRVKNRANDTTQFLIRGDGNVGIGTAVPGSELTSPLETLIVRSKLQTLQGAVAV